MEVLVKYLSKVSTLKAFPENCAGCGKCLDVCPHSVLTMAARRISIHDIDRCMECGACTNNCAFEALKVKTGVGCASAIINGFLTNSAPSCDCGAAGSVGTCC
ncbi:MAG: 4Fe-4S dicluster domain-containing protein [Nitrospirae bacterium]|nr:4Fe-4S dicluster domain-containing protein [Nitrospirota bacterium]